MLVGGFCSRCWMPATLRTASRKPRKPKFRRCDLSSASGPTPSQPCSLDRQVTTAWPQFLLQVPMASLPPVVPASALKHPMTAPAEGTLATRQRKMKAGTMVPLVAAVARPSSKLLCLLINYEPCPARIKGQQCCTPNNISPRNLIFS